MKQESGLQFVFWGGSGEWEWKDGRREGWKISFHAVLEVEYLERVKLWIDLWTCVAPTGERSRFGDRS